MVLKGSKKLSINIQRLAARMLIEMKPHPPMDVATFCDTYRFLSPETAEKVGPWETRITPYLSEPMNQMNNKRCREIIFKTGVQLGKTEFIMNSMLYAMVRKPGSMLVVFPKKKAATDEFTPKRLNPMIRDCPILHDIFPREDRKYINNKENKTYVGGSIRMSGTDATDLCSTPVRYAFVDEVSRCPPTAGNEGDVFQLIKARQSNFFDSKFVATSTPTEEGFCNITALFEPTRQHVYEIKCPHCQDYIVLEWEQMEWQDDSPETARYICQKCNKQILDKHKYEFLLSGRWVCITPERAETSMGYELSSIYSPWVGFSTLVDEYLKAKRRLARGDEESMKTFVNTRLARTYEPKTEGVDPSALFARCEKYKAQVPSGGLVLVAGVDVNGNDICCEIVAYGRNNESWGIDYRIFYGDTSQSEAWKQLEDYLLKKWMHEWGFLMKVEAVAIDQGYSQKQAEAFCKKHEGRRFFAVKGEGGWGKPVVGDRYNVAHRSHTTRKVPLYPICDAEAKVKVYSDLRQEGGENYCHFPKAENEEINPYSKKYFKELTCEKIRTKYRRGFAFKEFEKPSHMRNEPLDCRKYALCARIILNPNYDALYQRALRKKGEIEYLRDTGMGKEEAAHTLDGASLKRVINENEPNNPLKKGWVNSW